MRVADEQQKERIAAELEDVSAVPLSRLDQAVEDPGDRQHELLGARSALLPARRSARAVNPEMSTETSEPSRLLARGASCSRLHPRTSRGRYGESALRPAVVVVSVISQITLFAKSQ